MKKLLIYLMIIAFFGIFSAYAGKISDYATSNAPKTTDVIIGTDTTDTTMAPTGTTKKFRLGDLPVSGPVQTAINEAISGITGTTIVADESDPAKAAAAASADSATYAATAGAAGTAAAVAGEAITTGTVADIRIASSIARDSEVTAAVAITATGFDGNLGPTVDTIQELAQAVDGLVLGSTGTITADSIDPTKAAAAVTAGSIAPVKVSGVPGYTEVFGASGTLTGIKGEIGPDASFATNYFEQWNGSGPTYGDVKVYGTPQLIEESGGVPAHYLWPYSFAEQSGGATINDSSASTSTVYSSSKVAELIAGVSAASGLVEYPAYKDSVGTKGQYAINSGGTLLARCVDTNSWRTVGLEDTLSLAPVTYSLTLAITGDGAITINEEEYISTSSPHTITGLSGATSLTATYPGDNDTLTWGGTDVADVTGMDPNYIVTFEENKTLTAAFSTAVAECSGGSEGYIGQTTNGAELAQCAGTCTTNYIYWTPFVVETDANQEDGTITHGHWNTSNLAAGTRIAVYNTSGEVVVASAEQNGSDAANEAFDEVVTETCLEAGTYYVAIWVEADAWAGIRTAGYVG